MAQNIFDKVIYSPDFQLDGAHLVEASAGTGKTYNIQNIYARLIMEKGLKVSEILVVTFTDAATKELRDRLHLILQNIQGRFCTPQKDCPGKNKDEIQSRNKQADDLIRCTQNKPLARMNVEMALLEFDQSAISTIHGFCQRVLTRYAFETGINLMQEIENNKVAELNALAEDWWRNPPAEAPGERTLSTLKTYIRKLAGKSDYMLSAAPPVKKEKMTKKDIKQGNLIYMMNEADKIVNAYEKARAERQTLNFDDLLRALRDALREMNPRSNYLVIQLRKEFKAALIDEFQDTDPVQYEIFERIFLNGSTSPLFFVGDPKQAIYAFRGGDIYAYLKAKSKLEQSVFCLSTNHRSTQRMMDAVNEMFLDTDGQRTFEHEQICYEYPVRVPDPPMIKELLPEEKPLRIIQFPADVKMPQVLELMTKEITELLSRQKYDEEKGRMVPVFSPGDIAILTHSNTRNRAIQQILQKANIPSVIQRSGNVFASPVAKELWIFLQAVADPTRKNTVRCAETTVFGANSIASCSDSDDLEFSAKLIERFRELNRLWQKHGLGALIAKLEKQQYRLRLAARENGERQLSDITQIWELCFAAMKQHGSSPENLISWLGERINRAPIEIKSWGESVENDESDSEEYSRELESDANAVKIMTIHIAKGLEFPVVFLPDCWNFTGGNLLRPYEFHMDGSEVFSVNNSDKTFAETESRQEKIRLLYVAMTRAVQRMILFTPVPETITKEPLSKLLTNLIARGGGNPPYEIVAASLDPCTEKYSAVAQNVSWKAAEKPPEFSTAPSKGSFSSLFYKQEKEEDDERDIDSSAEKFRRSSDTADENEHPVFQLPGGAAIGNCWHNILEKISFNADEPEIRKIAEEELTDGGLIRQDEILDVTAEMIQKTLHYKIHSPTGESFSLCSIPQTNRLSEQEFDFSASHAQMNTGILKKILHKYWDNDPSKAEFLKNLSGEVRVIPKGFMTGFIDLIFKHGDYFYIIDWKSNSIGGKRENFTETGVRREIAQHLYFFQYLLYAVTLHFYLKQTLGNNYSWDRNFGGIRYFFLRGITAEGETPVYEDRPSAELLDELGHAFGLTEKE